MPPLNELPGNISRDKFTKALERLGFELNKRGGNGSHYKATWPRTQKVIVIQKKISKYTLKYILDEIEKCSGISWNEIENKL